MNSNTPTKHGKPRRMLFMWMIENLSHMPCIRGLMLSSPVFSVKDANDSFQFNFYPGGSINENYIGLFFEQLPPSSQVKIYNCSLWIGNSDTVLSTSRRFRNTRFSQRIGSHYFLKNVNTNFLTKTVTLQCILSEITAESLHGSLLDVEMLSEDLKCLYESKKYSDLTVVLHQHVFKVHQCVLFSRCPSLFSEYGYENCHEWPVSVEITDVSLETFSQLLYHLYTGELQNLEISLDLFQYANRVKAFSIINCLIASDYEYSAHTKILLGNQIITWNLDGIQYWYKGSLALIRIPKTDSDNIRHIVMQLTLPENSIGEKIFNISFKIIGFSQDRPISLTCDISLYYSSGTLASRKAQHVFLQDEVWLFPEFIKLNDIPLNIAVCGARLKAELHIYGCTGQRYRTVRRSDARISTDFNTVIPSLKMLQSAMKNLYEYPYKMGQLTLLTRDNYFRMSHAPILWIRWPGIRSTLETLGEISTISELGVPLNFETLMALLSYIYYGYFSDLNEEYARELLEINETLEMSSRVVEICKAILES
ncbi:hypothetical protein CEXT_655781 [Caerostris extrusa]|uniref:BTB domain-containing protein n=1 Tax=Caerostris extrusa TaxID=172846 RepID=A0AAV4MST0_CAEEX|nr:hypothetical protein CEXT_655781 [Caerostris extrusa]